ncbi:hypothetical protein [Acinetobacter sp. BSP-53]|uniref:hypothetical protein n=1 Tax=Acinetobacter sp. BSP-53 TaxID=3344662 RepID=UPI00377018CE
MSGLQGESWRNRYSILGGTVNLSEDILFCCRDQWIAQACKVVNMVLLGCVCRYG